MDGRNEFENMNAEEFESLVDEVLNEDDAIEESVEDEVQDNNNYDEPSINEVMEDTVADEPAPEVDTGDEESDGNSPENDDDVALAAQQELVNNNEGETIDTPEVVNNEDSTLEDEDVQPEEESTTEVKIPEEYMKAKEFYDKLVSTEFVANGKKLKLFTDIDKIVQMHQMAYGFHKKNEGFNKYRPYIQVLKDNGFIDNPQKFDLAIAAAKGDKDAIKALATQNNIELIDEVPENIGEYTPDSIRPSDTSLMLDEIVDTAMDLGFGDKLIDSLNRMDDTSLDAFVTDNALRESILKHMQDGTYDLVEQKIYERELGDMYGTYKQLPYVQKYATAYEELAKAITSKSPVQQQVQQSAVTKVTPQVNTSNVANEEYIAKTRQQEQQINEQRKKAALATGGTRKTVPKQTKKETFDPLKLAPGDFSDFLDKALAGEIDF